MVSNQQGFEILDHPADMGFRAWAASLPDLFSKCAQALTSVLIDLESASREGEKKVEITGDDVETLLYKWLSEILYLFDGENLAFSKFSVEQIEQTSNAYFVLSATLAGENIAGKQVKTYVKAITFHQLSIENKDGTFFATVYLDI